MNRRRQRILLVEDSPSDQVLVARALQHRVARLDLDWVRRLADARERLAEQEYDAIVLDLSLPDADRHTTLSTIRRAAPDVPIVVLTGASDEEYALKLVGEGGVQDYLTKSYALVEPVLERSICYAIERFKAARNLRAMETQLLEAQKMESIGRLAGGVAHDLNNILTTIFAFGNFVLEALPPDDPAHGDMSEVLLAAQRAEQLTSQLLAFSRRRPVVPRVIDANAAIGTVARILRRTLGEDIEIVTHLTDEATRVTIDPSALEQVLVNLAVNARDAMPGGGRLTIETGVASLVAEAVRRRDPESPPGDYVHIAVSDTGFGMDDNIRRRIFEPFFTTKEEGKGTGLGLSSCYGIVKQAGGFISVYSEVGRGTTFKVQLPATRNPVQSPARTFAEVAMVTGTESVLVVEDDPQVRMLTVRTLTELGYRVTEAAAGAEALELCADRDEPFALLLTDVVMPGITGKRLAQTILRAHPTTKILFMSGYTANAIDQLDGLELVHKPFHPSTLAAAVRAVLDGQAHLTADIGAPRVLLVSTDAVLIDGLRASPEPLEVVVATTENDALFVLAHRNVSAVVVDDALVEVSVEELETYLIARDPTLAERIVVVRDEDKAAGVASIMRELGAVLGLTSPS